MSLALSDGSHRALSVLLLFTGDTVVSQQELGYAKSSQCKAQLLLGRDLPQPRTCPRSNHLTKHSFNEEEKEENGVL